MKKFINKLNPIQLIILLKEYWKLKNLKNKMSIKIKIEEIKEEYALGYGYSSWDRMIQVASDCNNVSSITHAYEQVLQTLSKEYEDFDIESKEEIRYCYCGKESCGMEPGFDLCEDHLQDV